MPLALLVLTAKGNISQIADVLLKQNLRLERPGSMWSPYFKVNDKLIYHNPHEGIDTSAVAGPSRWVQPPMATKNVEIQRGAADAVFENLRGEEDLPETSPGEHQDYVGIDKGTYANRDKHIHFFISSSKKGPLLSFGT